VTHREIVDREYQIINAIGRDYDDLVRFRGILNLIILDNLETHRLDKQDIALLNRILDKMNE